ncbi:hypothetical protein PINS_up007427 [Pythium insidiosum]|nr:hypothetical protein PINS_up007427 [Pythium insidiosum]
MCALNKARCETKQPTLGLRQAGACPETPSPSPSPSITTAAPPATQTPSPSSLPTTVPPSGRCQRDCSKVGSTPVCDNTGRKYDNLCYFVVASCENHGLRLRNCA